MHFRIITSLAYTKHGGYKQVQKIPKINTSYCQITVVYNMHNLNMGESVKDFNHLPWRLGHFQQPKNKTPWEETTEITGPRRNTSHTSITCTSIIIIIIF